MLRLQHQHETLTTWNFPLPLQCGIPRLYLWVCRHALSDALSSSIVLVHYPNTHTHSHTLQSGVHQSGHASEEQDWQLACSWSVQKQQAQTWGMQQHTMACFNCFLVRLCMKIRMFENTRVQRVQNQNNTAMFRSPRAWRCVRRTIVNWHLEHFPSLRYKRIQTMKCGIFMCIQCLFEMLMLATNEQSRKP